MADSATLKLQVILSTLDKATAPMRRISAASKEAAQATRKLREQMRELEKQQALIGQFRKQLDALKQLRQERNASREAVRRLTAAQQAAVAPTKAQRAELEKAVASSEKFNLKASEQAAKLRQLRDQMVGVGLSTFKLDSSEKRVRDSLKATTDQIQAQKVKLAELADKYKAAQAARARYDTAMGRARTAAVTGAIMTGSGMALLGRLRDPLAEARHDQSEQFRIAAIGLGEQQTREAVRFATTLKTYGTSVVDNMGLMRDAMTVFADVHHAEMVTPTLARMKFANEALFGADQAADNEKKFLDMLRVIELRGGLQSPDAFASQADIVQRVLTATGGRVGPEEWLNVIKTGGIAAKGISDQAFYYQLEPLVQEMGGFRVGTAMMSAYQNLYQGRTTKRAARQLESLGLIADSGKVQHDKAGQISFLNPGALLGADVFRRNQFEWVETVLLPQLAKKGITDQQQILDAIGSIITNRTASNLFGQMVLQRDQIHKNARLNAGADGIGEIEAKARGALAGQELEAVKKRADLFRELGRAIMPAYTAAVTFATEKMQQFTAWMQANPRAAQLLVTSLAVLAATLVALGGAMLVLAPMAMSFIVLRHAMALAGAGGGILSAALGGVGTALGVVRTAVVFLGRALLMTPIGRVIGLIVLAATLIYQHWEPIKAYVQGVWTEIRQAFDGGIGSITALIVNWSPLGLFYQAFAGVLRWFGLDLPATLTGAGTAIMRGLANGITNGISLARDAIVGAGETLVGLFKEKLGIRSPSRVFAALGEFTMRGLAVGLDRGEREPLQQLQRTSQRLAAAAAIGGSIVAAPALAFDSRPPLASGGQAVAAPIGGNHYEIHVNGTPGMNEQALARAVAAELDRREAAARARTRSTLTDYDN
ncbi:phage tail protein [Pigmentiphaga sp. CHJ604]|uniref:phage tail protein n=1 Tax=Pigmentiphaga sp. CHJ604 TaxID=3081984 RepID=UPI0030CFECF2